MSQSTSQTSATSMQNLRRLLSYLLPYKARTALAIGCMLIMAACTTLFAHLIQPLFDEGFIGQNTTFMLLIPLALLIVTLIKSAATYTQGVQLEFIGLNIVATLQRQLFAKLVRQDLKFSQKHPPAELTNRFLFDLQRLQQSISDLIGGGLRDLTVTIGLVANLFWKDPILATMSLIIIPFAAYPILRFGKLMRKYSNRLQHQAGVMAAQLTESFHFRRQIQADTAEKRVEKTAGSLIDNLFDSLFRAGRARAASSPVLEAVVTLAIVGVIYLGLWRASEGHLSPGAFASFLAALLLLVRPVKGLTNLNNTLQEGLAAAERTFTLLDAPVELKQASKAKKLTVTSGKIEFNAVQFAYQADESPVLNDFTLTLPAKKNTALVGASGAGKSTVLNLVPRFFAPQQGQIYIDGQDISQVSLQSLREQISLVSQDIAIFADTVAANIAFSKPKATQAEIVAAAKAAQAHDFIEQLADGYQTRLGPGGIDLSGGQKQRLAIARAILKNAPILLLDEATASLDSEAEQAVQTALQKLGKNRTTLTIAHRLSTVVNADQIIVLQNGEIVEQGTHVDLIRRDGHYARLWRFQQGER